MTKQHIFKGLAGAFVFALVIGASSLAQNTTQPATQPATQPVTRPATQPATQPVSSEGLRSADELHTVLRDAMEAHGGLDTWREKGTVHFLLETTMLNPAGRPKNESNTIKISYPTDGRNVVTAKSNGQWMRYTDGKTEVFDSEGNPVSSEAAHQMAWFLLPTLQYITALPFKLGDEGVNSESIDNRIKYGRGLNGLHVTYDEEAGETPEDWYKFYFDEQEGNLVEVLWIVTAQDNLIEWAQPSRYKVVDGLLLPHRWTFIPANADGEITGPPMMTIDVEKVWFGNESGDCCKSTKKSCRES